nr:bifunctional polysaccharide deacetylase/glycosyltransferase family 2 protein [Arthrobacter sp. SF27]
MDLLLREGVPSTFFSLGQNVVKNPDVFQRIIREGHMVANHTMSHIDFYEHGDVRNREELIGTDRIMRSVGGYATRLFRIPKGDPDNNALAVLQAQQLGYLHVDMDMDTLDWSYDPGEEIPVPELDGDGHIILMHDGGGDRSGTVAVLAKLIEQAKDKGYTFTTLAPIVPTGYLPVKSYEAGLVDHATAAVNTLYMVAPPTLISWLFWFGIGSLTLMTLAYIVLALIGHRRQTRKQWSALDEASLPLVSVILPVFNEEPVILKTLQALKNSDYTAMEVIAVNDGSTDNTLAVMNEFARDWPGLRVLTQANGGKSAASNFGIAMARGEIIVTLDGDTLFESQTVRMLARHFCDPDGGDRVGAVAGHVKVGNRRNLLTAWQSLEYISGICVTRMAEGLVGAISIVPGACAGWRKEALDVVGGYSHDTMAEDADLTLCIQRLGYRIVQENKAVAWTEAPMTVSGLAKQRLRWTYGNIQALRKHYTMILRPKYGVLGMVALPYALLSTLVPLVFMPLTVVVAGISLANGNWQSIAWFALFVAVTHFVISVIALTMVKESLWHLLMVPIYRLIYEPLRAYLLYAALIQAMRGQVVGWYKPERTNSVIAPSMSTRLST